MQRTMGTVRFMMVLALAGCGMCGGDTSDLSADEKQRVASEVVRTFYAELADGDCATIGKLLANEHSEGDCVEMVEELGHREVELVDIAEAYVDGRDPDAVVVRVQIEDRGEVNEMLMRVIREDGDWKLKM